VSKARESGVLRDADAADNLELLLVAAIVTILSIRGFLHLTGYPQVGGDGLHIAHMLWGGLFMLIAVGMYVVFWNPSARRFASFLAGVGWGTFIDELGKFITDDHNYFFEPTIALLYVMFLVSFLAVRAIRTAAPLSASEEQLNHRLHELDSGGRMTGLASHYFGLRGRLDRAYDRLSRSRWFVIGLIVLVVVDSAWDLGQLLWWAFTANKTGFALQRGALSEMVSLLLAWIGIFNLRRSRLAAFRWFQRAVLVSLLFTQIARFSTDQFGALIGLLINLVVYTALRYLLVREEEFEAEKTGAGPAPG
jgi:hypothetical protein